MKDARSYGFTLVEVLVAVVVFAIAVVGLVALMGRSVESSRAAVELRQAERLAQGLMAELRARGFVELLAQGTGDAMLAPQERRHDLGRPPADVPPGEPVVGAVDDALVAFRSVDLVFDPADPPSLPPVLPEDLDRIDALRIEVLVLWIDQTNPAAPPPASLQVSDLVPPMADPDDPEFRPYVGHVRLTTVRVNDASAQEVTP